MHGRNYKVLCQLCILEDLHVKCIMRLPDLKLQLTEQKRAWQEQINRNYSMTWALFILGDKSRVPFTWRSREVGTHAPYTQPEF